MDMRPILVLAFMLFAFPAQAMLARVQELVIHRLAQRTIVSPSAIARFCAVPRGKDVKKGYSNLRNTVDSLENDVRSLRANTLRDSFRLDSLERKIKSADQEKGKGSSTHDLIIGTVAGFAGAAVITGIEYLKKKIEQSKSSTS